MDHGFASCTAQPAFAPEALTLLLLPPPPLARQQLECLQPDGPVLADGLMNMFWNDTLEDLGDIGVDARVFGTVLDRLRSKAELTMLEYDEIATHR